MKQVVQQGARARRSGGLGALAAVVAVVATAAALFSAPVPVFARTYDPVTAQVPVEVKVEGDKPAKDETFTFTMAPADGEEVLPKEDTLTVTGAGKAAFELSFNEVGEHHYTVTQTPGNADCWTYDTQVYDVTAFCMWDEQKDEIYTEVYIKDSKGGKTGACTFTNSYKAPAKPVKPAKGLPQTGDQQMYAVAAILAVGLMAVGAGVALQHRRNK